jgi:hypothetical protein
MRKQYGLDAVGPEAKAFVQSVGLAAQSLEEAAVEQDPRSVIERKQVLGAGYRTRGAVKGNSHGGILRQIHTAYGKYSAWLTVAMKGPEAGFRATIWGRIFLALCQERAAERENDFWYSIRIYIGSYPVTNGHLRKPFIQIRKGMLPNSLLGFRGVFWCVFIKEVGLTFYLFILRRTFLRQDAKRERESGSGETL